MNTNLITRTTLVAVMLLVTVTAAFAQSKELQPLTSPDNEELAQIQKNAEIHFARLDANMKRGIAPLPRTKVIRVPSQVAKLQDAVRCGTCTIVIEKGKTIEEGRVVLPDYANIIIQGEDRQTSVIDAGMSDFAIGAGISFGGLYSTITVTNLTIISRRAPQWYYMSALFFEGGVRVNVNSCTLMFNSTGVSTNYSNSTLIFNNHFIGNPQYTGTNGVLANHENVKGCTVNNNFFRDVVVGVNGSGSYTPINQNSNVFVGVQSWYLGY